MDEFFGGLTAHLDQAVRDENVETQLNALLTMRRMFRSAPQGSKC
jgi:hypothetical protein